MSNFNSIYNKWSDFLEEAPSSGMGTPPKPMTGATDPTKTQNPVTGPSNPTQPTHQTQNQNEPANQVQQMQAQAQPQAQLDNTVWDQYSQQDIINYLSTLSNNPNEVQQIIDGMPDYLQQMQQNKQNVAAQPASGGVQ